MPGSLPEVQHLDSPGWYFLEDQFLLHIQGVSLDKPRYVPHHRSKWDEDDHPRWLGERPRLQLRRHHGEEKESKNAPQQRHDGVLLEERKRAGERKFSAT